MKTMIELNDKLKSITSEMEGLDKKIKDLSVKIQYGLLTGPELSYCQDDLREYNRRYSELKKQLCDFNKESNA